LKQEGYRHNTSLSDIAKYTAELASNFRSVIENAGLLFQVKTDGIMPPVYVDKKCGKKLSLISSPMLLNIHSREA
jgi:hypothetical protein